MSAQDQVMADIEAQRVTTAEPALESDLSIKDWVDRIAGSTRQAAGLARQPNAQLEYDAWIEVAAIVAGRAEQVLKSVEEPDLD